LKRLSTVVLTLLMAAGLGFTAVAAQPGASHGNIGTNAIAQDQGATAAPPADFGSPPTGQYPILYNDHHVYTKPDILKRGRVLAALVRGGTILIPLRSMFEQMGPPYPTVSWDGGSKTATVSKPGAEVKVTVGKPEVIINGESRPLDVPPEIYQGTVLVPVRVISEAMGAYVLWVPDRRLVVVRYIPATPPPAPPPPPPPAATPTPTPPPYYDFYVAGDYIISPKVYNEFVPGSSSSNNNGGFSYRIHGAIEYPIDKFPFMVEVDYRQYNWQHNCGGADCFVTAIGGLFQTSVPSFTGRDYSLDARLGIRILKPRIYLVGGYLWRSNNYGYPNQTGGGVGLEKLPDLDHVFSFYGSALYYFGVNGNYTSTSGIVNGQFPGGSCSVAAPCHYNIGYNILRFDLGVSYSFPSFPLFIEAGFLGDRGWQYNSAPIGFSESGPYAGIGLKISNW
jgi:hypothetical protein